MPKLGCPNPAAYPSAASRPYHRQLGRPTQGDSASMGLPKSSLLPTRRLRRRGSECVVRPRAFRFGPSLIAPSTKSWLLLSRPHYVLGRYLQQPIEKPTTKVVGLYSCFMRTHLSRVTRHNQKITRWDKRPLTVQIAGWLLPSWRFLSTPPRYRVRGGVLQPSLGAISLLFRSGCARVSSRRAFWISPISLTLDFPLRSDRGQSYTEILDVHWDLFLLGTKLLCLAIHSRVSSIASVMSPYPYQSRHKFCG